jgi:copper chaperone CopZ
LSSRADPDSDFDLYEPNMRCDNCVANTRNHHASHEPVQGDMKKEPEHADSSLSETMVARIETQELADPARQKQITEGVEALDGVIELKIEKGALHVSYDPLVTTDQKIEEAIRSTGNTVKAMAADRETPHPDLPKPANGEQAPVRKTDDSEQS